jgi:protein-histidine pros-kinase
LGFEEAKKGDPTQLGQIIAHLTGNAIKFTERGEIVLQVDTESQDPEGVVLHFMVLDTGIGIPPDMQQVIFELFSNAYSSMTRGFTGAGLGLALSARLVGMMGGRIWVESEPGLGSRCHFTARFERAEGKG